MSLEKKTRPTKKDLKVIKTSLRRHIHLPSRIVNAEADFNERIQEMLEEDVDSLARQYYSLYGSRLRKDVIATISSAYRYGHKRGDLFGNPDYTFDFDIP